MQELEQRRWLKFYIHIILHVHVCFDHAQAHNSRSKEYQNETTDLRQKILRFSKIGDIVHYTSNDLKKTPESYVNNLK